MIRVEINVGLNVGSQKYDTPDKWIELGTFNTRMDAETFVGLWKQENLMMLDKAFRYVDLQNTRRGIQ